MQFKHSIKNKIMFTVTASFLCMILFVLIYSIIGVRKIVTNEKEDAYTHQLEIISTTLQKKYEKLIESGMADLYEEHYKQSLLKDIQVNYYNHGHHEYPMIIDSNHRVVLHPKLPTNDSSFQDNKSFQKLIESPYRNGSYSLQNQTYWATYRVFEPWQWTVVYTISNHDKNQAVNQFTLTLVGILIPTAMIFLIFMAWIIKRMIAPLLAMTSIVQDITNGDLTCTIKVEGHDEIHLLAKHFNLMVSNLKQILSHVQEVVNQITINGRKINTVSEKQANGAAQHALSVSETATATEELSRASEQIGEHIQTISQMSHHVLDGMESIKKSTDQTNQILGSLNEKSKQIGTITSLINDIADQTNLLAVNAAIEAARAGEQGRGFTVVADQIGKLADSTAKSTKDITALVELIQHEMSNVTLAMEQSLAGVEQEITLTKESATKSQEIALGVQEQIRGAQQIANAMSGIEATMKDIVDGAQQSAKTAQQLTDLADGLQESVTQFKTVEASPHAN